MELTITERNGKIQSIVIDLLHRGDEHGAEVPDRDAQRRDLVRRRHRDPGQLFRECGADLTLDPALERPGPDRQSHLKVGEGGGTQRGTQKEFYDFT